MAADALYMCVNMPQRLPSASRRNEQDEDSVTDTPLGVYGGETLLVPPEPGCPLHPMWIRVEAVYMYVNVSQNLADVSRRTQGVMERGVVLKK
jgi:hypothetical protein